MTHAPARPRETSPKPGATAVLLAAAVGWVAVIATRSREDDALYWFSFLVPGVVFVVAGVGAWWGRPENRTGKLMVLIGFGFLFTTLEGTRDPVTWTIGALFGNVPFVLLLCLIVVFPRGMPSSSLERGIIGMTAAVFAALLIPIAFLDPAALGCTNCPPGLNLLLFSSNPELFLSWNTFVAPFIIATIVAVGVLVVVRWVRATGPGRWVIGPVAIPAVILVLAHAFQVVVITWVPLAVPYALGPLRYTSAAGIAVLPLAFLLGLARLQGRRQRIGDMLVELDSQPAKEEGGELPSTETEVSDDGIGGADASRGSGLRGLQDRVAAIGGRLEITSAPGSGTTLAAELPTDETS